MVLSLLARRDQLMAACKPSPSIYEAAPLDPAPLPAPSTSCTPDRRTDQGNREIGDGATPEPVDVARACSRPGSKVCDIKHGIPENSSIWDRQEFRTCFGEVLLMDGLSSKLDDCADGEVGAQNDVTSKFWSQCTEINRTEAPGCKTQLRPAPATPAMRSLSRQIELAPRAPRRSKRVAARICNLSVQACSLPRALAMPVEVKEAHRRESHNQRPRGSALKASRRSSRLAAQSHSLSARSLNLSGAWTMICDSGQAFKYVWSHIPGSPEFRGVYMSEIGQIHMTGVVDIAAGDLEWRFDNGSNVICKGKLTKHSMAIAVGFMYCLGTKIGTFTGTMRELRSMKQNAVVKKGPGALSKPAVVLALPTKRRQQTRSRQPQATRRRGELGTIRDGEASSCDEDASGENYPRAALGPPSLITNTAASFQAVSSCVAVGPSL